MKKLLSIVVLSFMFVFVNLSIAESSAIDVAKNVEINYAPGTTMEQLINNHPYYYNIKWNVRSIEGPISTVVAVCTYDFEKAQSITILKELRVQYIFDVYTADPQSGRVSDVEVIIIDENSRMILKSYKNGLLSSAQIGALLQGLCTGERF